MKIIRVLVISGDEAKIKQQLELRLIQHDDPDRYKHIFGEKSGICLHETFIGDENDFIGATKHSLIEKIDV